MAGKKEKKTSIYLDEQSAPQLIELVNYLKDRVSEMEMDEEILEESGQTTLPLLRGLIAFLKEEHLEDEVAEVPDLNEDEWDGDSYEESEEESELDFE